MLHEGVINLGGHPLLNIQDSQGVSASEMNYIVSGGALNPTHSLVSAMCKPTRPTQSSIRLGSVNE